MLHSTTSLAQSRIASEAGRGYPYSSEQWSWGPFVFLFVLIVTLGIAMEVKATMRRQHWSHPVLVIVAVLGSSFALMSAMGANEMGLFLFTLIPSVAVVVFAILGILSVTGFVVWVNHLAYRRIRELEKL
jgi:hypothetical protein